MKINIIAIGKVKEKYLCDALDEYIKRISRYADIEMIQLADAPPSKTAKEQQEIEGRALLEKAKGFVIALDGRGKQLSSEDLAALVSDKCTSGESEFSFLIGGSHGHGDEVLGSANFVLSFGKMTFPHQLFRVMLTEQVYRALTINANLPYHK